MHTLLCWDSVELIRLIYILHGVDVRLKPTTIKRLATPIWELSLQTQVQTFFKQSWTLSTLEQTQKT